jgi:hypothetical protein
VEGYGGDLKIVGVNAWIPFAVYNDHYQNLYRNTFYGTSMATINPGLSPSVAHRDETM